MLGSTTTYHLNHGVKMARVGCNKLSRTSTGCPDFDRSVTLEQLCPFIAPEYLLSNLVPPLRRPNKSKQRLILLFVLLSLLRLTVNLEWPPEL